MFINKLLIISLLCWGSASCRLWYPEDLQDLMKFIFPKPSTDPPEVESEFSDLSTPSEESNEVNTDAPVTEPAGENQQCPPDESSFSKKDISVLVEYMANKMNIYQKINDSYYMQAVSIRDKHENDVKNYQRRLEERPQHLKHILEDLAALRKQLEPITTNINDSLQEYSSYEISLNKTFEHAQAVFKQLNKTKQICILMNCRQQHLKMRAQHNEYPYMLKGESQDSRYCSTLTRITEKTTASLSLFENEFIKNMSNSLIHEDTHYIKNIQDLKKNLKELGVEKFGITMYDILNIQDDYYHLFEALNNNNLISDLEEIKKNGLQIDYLLVKLESALKKYEKYCTSCKQLRLVYHSLSPQNDDSPNNSQITKDMVDEYINMKISEIETNIMGNYTNIFKELNEMLNVKDLDNTYFANLKPIQAEITNDIIKEREHLDKLKSSFPPETIDKVSELYKKSKDMVQTINDELNSIASFTN